MTYLQSLQYLESFINYEKIPAYPYKESLKLERIKGFLDTINNPQDHLKCIHVAGTKGKGSTCAFIAYILREAGYRVGLYTSPHLSDFRERIRILSPRSPVPGPRLSYFEGMILKKELADLVGRLRPAIEKCNKNSKYGPLTFFEVYTSLAFVYFKEENVDFLVLETGLGGRLDATSVVNPLACVITPISYEHTQKLGHTLREIATEKAGIIKVPQRLSTPAPQPIVISAPQEREPGEVIRDKCKKTGIKLYEVGKDIKFRVSATKRGGGANFFGGHSVQQFTVHSLTGRYTNLKIRLLGRHQLTNATAAVGIIEALRSYNTNIDIDSIRGGLYNTVWPGRCEVMARNPLVVLDGAQNIASARVLKEAIKDNFKYKRLILVLGISSDKDILGICLELCPLADGIVLTRANNPRAADVNGIESSIAYFPLSIIGSKNVREAIKIAKGITSKRDLILVTGSLYVVGEARKYVRLFF